jgi:hypothetical protein
VPPEESGLGPVAGPAPLILWLLSDIQAATKAERQNFATTIADVNRLAQPPELAVIAGDLMASRSRPEDFTWFLATRNRARVGHWFEIAGNHDLRSEPLFSQYFPNPSYYSVEVGNLLLLLLSDELASSPTEIGDEAFTWWREMVLRHQDRIIVTVTHAPLAQSGLLGAGWETRQITDSERFAGVLRQAKVAIWAAGHNHLPHWLPGTVNRNEELGGTLFLNVSAIIEGTMNDSQSRFCWFTPGSNRVLIRSRNHQQGRFDPGLEVSLTLDKPFIWQGEAPIRRGPVNP